MKFSTVFLLTTAASTGSAAAVKNYVGHLRANAPQKNAEVFEEASLQTNQEALATCAATCKPDSKDADEFIGASEEEVAASMAACVDECVGVVSNNDPAARDALSGEASCFMSCTETAAEEFEEVSKDCAKMKSTNCKKGKDCDLECADGDSSCERKVKNCEKEFEDCEDCADEVEDLEKSVKKVGSALDKCIVNDCGAEFSIFYASALQKDTEVFEDTSLQTNQDTFTTCSASCKPNSKKASSYVGKSEEEVAAAMAACVDDCVGVASNNDPAARDALSSEATCATSCTGTAAKKFEEVSKDCADMKSSNCKKGKDCSLECEDGDKKCEKKVEKCEEEFDDCEECAEEVEDSEKSVKKVGSALDKCFVNDCGFEFSSFRAITLQEDTEVFEDTSLQTNQEALESCAATCKPDSKDADEFIGASEEEVAASMAACVDECYGIASDDPAARDALSGEAACAISCAETSAEEFEEVSKDCAKMKSTNCKKGKDCDLECAEGDSSCEKKVKKCEEEFEDCEDCADEVEDLEKSVKKVGRAYDECFLDGCVTQFAVEIAQQ